MDTGRVVVVTGAAGGIGTQLANCAGHFPSEAFQDMTTDDFAAIVGTNLVGTFAVTRAVVPLMPGRGWAGSSTSAPARSSTRPRARRTTSPPRPACSA